MFITVVVCNVIAINTIENRSSRIQKSEKKQMIIFCTHINSLTRVGTCIHNFYINYIEIYLRSHLQTRIALIRVTWLVDGKHDE